MGYDDVFQYIGSYGPYQRRIHLLTCLPALTTAFHRLVGVFLLAEPDFRCNPGADNNSAFFPNSSYTCTRPGNGTDDSLPCRQWLYDNSTYEESVVTEFNLVCEDSWLVPTGQATIMFGELVGSIAIGLLSDKYGRKPTFFMSLLLQLTFGTVLAFLNNVFAFMVVRVLIGMVTAGVSTTAYVIGIELVGPNKRLLAAMIMEFFWTLGYGILGAIAYYVRDWRTLQLAVTGVGIIFLPYWWIIPESPRWMITKGQAKEARDVLLKAAKENKVTIPDGLLEEVVNQNSTPEKPDTKMKETTSLLDLVIHPNLRKNSLTIFFMWFVNSCTYYGLSWNTSKLAEDDFLSFVIAGLAEFPAYVILLFTLDKWGRRPMECVTMLLGGLALILTLAVPLEMSWLTITFVMIGKMAITASFAILYIFSAELFPTVLRNVGIGVSCTFARVGGISAPYINLLSYTWRPLPQLMFGTLNLAAGLLVLVLPETVNKALPDTVAEGERFGKKS